MALATLLLLPFARNGRRGPSLGIIALQGVAILPALPPYFHAPGLLPAAASVSAAIGIALNVLASALVARGMRRAR
ncbi:hypothetical protein QT381_09615 [Galbitalea sp. SE-J8]|uniref:hypothetical protein n=1 Tax=Galbitalea sp. SE-J8 TaxID=3054952 RepID=UPI00259CBF90|nr:hypothetical protein [Galbitalea sp. SE-J8]MDM4763263.1 hypothetical protein [Galbitalea sp. SE-J8]